MKNKSWKTKFAFGTALIGVLLMAVLLSPSPVLSQELGKFQVVQGQGDNAFLINTKTGQVWILTYRTLATGREPVAIPYKFLMKRPNQDGFLTDEHDVPKLSQPNNK